MNLSESVTINEDVKLVHFNTTDGVNYFEIHKFGKPTQNFVVVKETATVAEIASAYANGDII